jgi:hypothetical protein
MMRFFRDTLLILLSALMGFSLPCVAWASSTFSGSASWCTSGNWSGGIPTSSVAAIIAAGSTVSIDSSCSPVALSLTVNSGSATTIDGSGNLTLSGPISLPSNTVWSNTGTLTVTATGVTVTFAGVSMGNTIINFPDGQQALLEGGGGTDTFSNLQLIPSPTANEPALILRANLNVTGTLTVQGNTGNGSCTATNNSGSCAGNIRFLIGNSIYEAGPWTVNVGAISATGAFDIAGVSAQTGGSSSTPWNLSGLRIGDRGGNSNITFPAGQNVYLTAANGLQDYSNVWCLASDGGSGCTPTPGHFPVRQDTVIYDNNTMSSGGNFVYHAGGDAAFGAVDASAMTNTATIGLPRNIMGSITYPANITPWATYQPNEVNARAAGTIVLNIANSIGNTPFPVFQRPGMQGTLKLGSNFTTTNTFTLYRGTLDVGGHTLTAGTFTNSGGTVESSVCGGYLNGTLYGGKCGGTLWMSDF